jgi:hypothetical protein
LSIFSAAVTAGLLVACSAQSKVPVSEPSPTAERASTRPAACGTRTCGPAPTTHGCGASVHVTGQPTEFLPELRN